MFNYDETNPDEARVQLFGKSNFEAPCADSFPVGNYNAQDLATWELWNPETGDVEEGRSIRVPEGLAVRLYTQDNFSGNSLLIEGPNAINLGDDSKTAPFKASISSMKVVKAYSFEVTGKWELVGEDTEPIDYAIGSGASISPEVIYDNDQTIHSYLYSIYYNNGFTMVKPSGSQHFTLQQIQYSYWSYIKHVTTTSL